MTIKEMTVEMLRDTASKRRWMWVLYIFAFVFLFVSLYLPGMFVAFGITLAVNAWNHNQLKKRYDKFLKDVETINGTD